MLKRNIFAHLMLIKLSLLVFIYLFCLIDRKYLYEFYFLTHHILTNSFSSKHCKWFSQENHNQYKLHCRASVAVRCLFLRFWLLELRVFMLLLIVCLCLDEMSKVLCPFSSINACNAPWYFFSFPPKMQRLKMTNYIIWLHEITNRTLNHSMLINKC